MPFSKNPFVVFSLVLLCMKPLAGQIIVDEPPRPVYYERTKRVTNVLKMKDMRDALHSDKLLLGQNRISGNISYNSCRVQENDGISVRNEIRSALGLYTRIRFIEEFSLNTTFYKDFNPVAAAPWISDFTYCFGRYNWRPNKFNYGYENYVNNKYSDNLQNLSEKFLEGYYFVSYQNNMSRKLTRLIKLDSTTNVKFTYFVRYAIHYIDENEVVHGTLLNGKPTAGIAVRYTCFWNIYFESAVYFYVHPTLEKEPWDPDYTYGFGYFDWRSFRLSLIYGNWAVNRFPWNKTYYPNYGFLDGNFRLAANFTW
jgi:hypothetical protein